MPGGLENTCMCTHGIVARSRASEARDPLKINSFVMRQIWSVSDMWMEGTFSVICGCLEGVEGDLFIDDWLWRWVRYWFIDYSILMACEPSYIPLYWMCLGATPNLVVLEFQLLTLTFCGLKFCTSRRQKVHPQYRSHHHSE